MATMKSKIINVALFYPLHTVCLIIQLCLNILISETLLLGDTTLKPNSQHCLFLVNVSNASLMSYPTATTKSKIINVALFTHCTLCVYAYTAMP